MPYEKLEEETKETKEKTVRTIFVDLAVSPELFIQMPPPIQTVVSRSMFLKCNSGSRDDLQNFYSFMDKVDELKNDSQNPAI